MRSVIPAWLMSAQPPLRQWLGLLARMTLGAFLTASVVVLLGFPLEPAAWSVVAVVVVLGYTAGASLVSGVNRMQGSIVGCLSGGVCQLLFGGWLWLPLVAAIAVAVSVSTCRLLRIGAGFRLGGALAAFFVFVPGAQEWQTVGWRLSATLIGISIAMVIALLLWPVRADVAVRHGIAAPIRDCVTVVDGAFARWTGGPEPEGVEASRGTIKAGTSAVAAALADRSHERAGSWEPSTYAELVSRLNDAMVAARRLDWVSVQREGDSIFTEVAEPFAVQADACRRLALDVADQLDAGTKVNRADLEQRADAISEAPVRIAGALDEMRSRHVTAGVSVEELQRLFAIALLLEHWSESVQQLATTLARA